MTDDLIRDLAGARRARSRSMTMNATTGSVEEGGETVVEGTDDDPLRSMWLAELARRRGERADPVAAEEVAEEETPRRPMGDVGQGPRGTPVEAGPSFDTVLRRAARGESAHSWSQPFDWSGS
jgi:hypothetical protein